ncbi:MAG: ATP-binding protein [Gammaproteobacteria bacterium]|nr:ATP-binding protein [Gammaproteobacteria bacterium]
MRIFMIGRQLDLMELLSRSSHFLLGPRGSGKSFLIRANCLEAADYIDLLDSRTYLRLKSDPALLHSLISKPLAVIDEIQRIPELLNEAHRAIETGDKRFLLTGSSARSLRRQGVNLLAGRAFRAELFPLTWFELSRHGNFDLHRYLRLGGLPSAFLREHGEDYLYAYVDTYLKEEIQFEGLVRSLPNYTRFLQSAAFNNSRVLNYAKVANDAQLPPNTVRDYYQILMDTLIGFQIPPWRGSPTRKFVQTTKFYLFDPGIVNALRDTRSLDPGSDLFGMAFEHFIACELRAFLSYSRIRLPLQFWRTRTGREVDFVIGDEIAIEVKSGKSVSRRDHKGLLTISQEREWKHLLVVSSDPANASFENGIRHEHWETFLRRLWNREYV